MLVVNNRAMLQSQLNIKTHSDLMQSITVFPFETFECVSHLSFFHMT